MRAIFAATALAAMVLVQPAAGQVEDDTERSPSELTAEAVDKLLKALDLLIGSIPQYEAPYVNENGDIIIRRKHPDGERNLPTPEHKPSPPDVDTTTT